MRQERARTGGLIVAVALSCMGTAGSARAGDDGYANVFSSLFTAAGIIKPDAPPAISYRERPPLVIPPQPGLPKPGQAIKRTAAWPQDPDVLARRKEDDEARAPRRSTVNDDGKITPAAELANGRAAGGEPVRPNECGVNGNSRNCLIVNPDELKRQGEAFEASNPSKDTLVAGQEPDRVYLTQPPKGYLKPNKAVKATAEAPIAKIDEASPYNFLKPSKEAE